MRKHLLRFILLRLLPGRLIPFLTVFEVLLLLRRMRRGASAPRKIVTSAPPRRPAVSVSTEPVPTNAKSVTPR
jgi:hypothetical protein